LASGSLEHDGAHVAIRESLDARVLLTEAHAAREQHDRRAQFEAAELDAQRVIDGLGFRVHAGRIVNAAKHRRIIRLVPFHIVIHEPEIPPNTGNLIRLAANTGCELHLIKPLGFRLDRKSVRRAGLDYDELATVHVHESFDAARAALPGRWFAIETGAARRHVDASFVAGDVLLFGSERRGLPAEILATIEPANVLSLPMRAGNRSLNLANAAAVAVYEAWRQLEFRVAPADPGA